MKTLEQLAIEAGMVDQLNMGAASCVYSHGCNGVTQEHLARFRAAVLEEAALICDGIERKKWETLRDGGKLEGIGPRDCAAAIREAKEKA